MKSVLSCVVMILSLLHASGTFEVTSKKVKNTLSPDAGVRFRSKTKAPTFQNVPAKFLTNGAIDRWPEMCFDKLELVDGVCKPQNYDDPELDSSRGVEIESTGLRTFAGHGYNEWS